MRYLVLPPPRKYVRALRAAARTALRMAAWNAAFIVAGLLLIALAGEAYFRLTKPFIVDRIPSRFVDGLGVALEPDAEVRYANWRDDNFVVSRTNGLGFLDREPVSAERAAEGCHIAFMGDSFVMAREVPIADKFQVRLEEMAARDLPHLGVTTQAYGLTGTGQINQLPFYDEYARRLRPKLAVLVFYLNDFANNSTALQSLAFGIDPDRMRHMSAYRDARGVMRLRPPDPEYLRFRLPRLRRAWHESVWERLAGVSYFAAWLDTKNIRSIWTDSGKPSQIAAWAAMIAERPCCASLLDGWRPVDRRYLTDPPFREEHLPSVFEEALEYTAFGVEQFKRRVERDGAKLVILSVTEEMGTRGDPQFDRLSAIAEARGIPVINQYDYIVSQGHNERDGRWRNDIHWNATGHQWAAEAVLEWLKANQEVCD